MIRESKKPENVHPLLMDGPKPNNGPLGKEMSNKK